MQEAADSASLSRNDPSLCIGAVIGGRFEIIASARSGGMASVFKAKDLETGRICALKVPRSDGDPELNSLAFNRECKALETLSHDNIVKFVDAGRDSSTGQNYLAIEWLKGDLTDKIRSGPASDWEAFYADIGRPLLLALVYAQSRGISHRDLKPDNVMFDALHSVKIVDFGIATALAAANFGRTLRHAGSVPYTPPEADDGVRSQSRDAYSWAVLATSCLSGKIFADLGAFQAALHDCDAANVPTSVLQKAASADPAKRYVGAIDLLADADTFHKKITTQRSIAVPLELSNKAMRLVASHWADIPPDELSTLVGRDLNAARGVQMIDEATGQAFRIVGATLEAICRKVSAVSPALRVEEVNILGLDRADMMRREMVLLDSVSFLICDYHEAAKHSASLRLFEARLRVAEAEWSRDAERQRRERWLDCWSAFLREKERYGRENRTKYHYHQMQRSGQQYVATCDGEIDVEKLTESLIIQRENGLVLLFKVLDVVVDQLVLELQGNYHESVPMANGYLESNHVAQGQAILRQKSALESVKRDRSASPLLRTILCDPASSPKPERSGIPDVASDLSKDKHDILERALGTHAVMAIEGPPGTGKTTLIAELLVIYLKRNPSHKVLLSSQTHIALDHVISKLMDKGLGSKIVRIHSDRTTKVDQAILPLTLEHKVKAWVTIAETRARKHLADRALGLGLNHEQIEVVVLGKQRQLLNSQVAELKENLVKLRSEIAESSELVSGEKSKVGKSDLVDATTTALDEAADLAELVAELEQRSRRIEEQLQAKGEFGRELASSDHKTSQEWIESLTPATEAGELFRGLVELQLSWLNRLGTSKDFYPAVLGEAKVVAGTCVGLGGY